MFFTGLLTSLTLAVNAAAIMPIRTTKISQYSTSPTDKVAQIIQQIHLFRPILALWNLLVIVLILFTF